MREYVVGRGGEVNGRLTEENAIHGTASQNQKYFVVVDCRTCAYMPTVACIQYSIYSTDHVSYATRGNVSDGPLSLKKSPWTHECETINA